MCAAEGLDPDSRVPYKDDRTMPLWTRYRPAAREEKSRAQAESARAQSYVKEQLAKYTNAPLRVVGVHQPQTLEQMETCMRVGNVVAGVICADGHLGYAQPVGAAIAYEDQVSISGVGYDIGCGNMAVKLNVKFDDVKDRVEPIIRFIKSRVSFGVGRANEHFAEHSLFDDRVAWKDSGMDFYKDKARAQLGTVGGGNHYIDLFSDEEGMVWIGVHFGSRGLGHTAATTYLKLAGGKDGIFVPPAVVDVKSDIGSQYMAAMHLAGRYAYAGREWVVEQCRAAIGGEVVHTVHNHHNFAWKERHHGKDCWVVRKGCTPAFPGQEGFIGGSMAEEAVIVEGAAESAMTTSMLASTVHGAGRNFGRKDAKRQFTREQMLAAIAAAGVTLVGGDVDESPMAYKRLYEVLRLHDHTIVIKNRLKPFAVMMAGDDSIDPFKD